MRNLFKKYNKIIFIVFIFSLPLVLSTPSITKISEVVFKDQNVSILNFGDVMFDRGVRNIIENRGRDPFEYIKKDLNLIDDFDVVIANLEGPIVEMERSLCQDKAYNFQFSPDTTDRLKEVGINMVNLANNHSFDCFRLGFESTKKYLNLAGIDYMGDSDLEKSYIIKIINGKKVAFIGIDETVQVVPLSSFYPLIKKLKTDNDFVVVNIHWGLEYELKESSRQREIAHRLIDSGADVIFGHHPHVLQPFEIYKTGVVFYSLGNFVFDQNFGDTTTGIGAGVEFGGDKKTFTVFPYKVKIFAPEFMKGEDKEKFCNVYLKSVEHSGCTFEI